MRRLLAMLLLAGCGGDDGGSTPIDAGGFDEILVPEPDAAVPLDARPLPSSWLAILEPVYD